jgi:hypothetical protein
MPRPNKKPVYGFDLQNNFTDVYWPEFAPSCVHCPKVIEALGEVSTNVFNLRTNIEGGLEVGIDPSVLIEQLEKVTDAFVSLTVAYDPSCAGPQLTEGKPDIYECGRETYPRDET